LVQCGFEQCGPLARPGQWSG